MSRSPISSDVHSKGCGDHYEVDAPSTDGSKNYHVILCTGEWHCDCKGFGFRRSCSHVTAAKLLHDNLESTIQRRSEKALQHEVDDAAELESKIRSWRLQLERQSGLTPAQRQKIEDNIRAALVLLGKSA